MNSSKGQVIFDTERTGMKIFLNFCYSCTLLFLALTIILVLFIGCLISEYDEYRIVLNADRKSGTIYTTKRNIQSDQEDPIKQKEDFENLVQDWKGDSYLLEKTQDGVYVKERNLSIEQGILVWKEISIFSDFHRLFRNSIVNDTMRIGFGNDETIVATNGELIRTKDSTIVQWPITASEFFLRVQKNEFKSTSDFVENFKSYMKKH